MIDDGDGVMADALVVLWIGIDAVCLAPVSVTLNDPGMTGGGVLHLGCDFCFYDYGEHLQGFVIVIVHVFHRWWHVEDCHAGAVVSHRWVHHETDNGCPHLVSRID